VAAEGRTGALPTILLAVTSAAMVLVTVGCFEFTEEIFVEDDGSCRLVWDIAVSEALLANEVGLTEELRAQHYWAQRSLGSLPGVKKSFLQEFSADGLRHFHYDIQLSHVGNITIVHSQLAQQAPLHEKGTSPTFQRKDDDLLFNQVLSTGDYTRPFIEDTRAPWSRHSDTAYDAQMELAQQVVPAVLADRYVTVRLHAPKIGLTNGLLSPDRKTVEWKVSLAELAAGKPVHGKLHAEIIMPFDWKFWLGILVPSVALIYALAVLIRGSSTPRRKPNTGGEVSG